MNKLSVVIITLNEAHNIKRCLESVSFADEIVVVDSGSTDNTVEIVKGFTDKVYHQDWLGFGPQKNKAIAKATGEWILSIDADEVVTDELALSIREAIDTDQRNIAFAIRRESFFCNRLIKHGDWRNDWILRLFRGNEAKFNAEPIHESVLFSGKQIKLSGMLTHFTQVSISASLEKMNAYSDLTAKRLNAKKKSSSLCMALMHYWWTFFRGFILKRGFLDGRHGFLVAQLSALGSYMKYVKVIFADKENT